MALGGKAGARPAGHLGMPTSDDALPRLVRTVPLPMAPRPRSSAWMTGHGRKGGATARSAATSHGIAPSTCSSPNCATTVSAAHETGGAVAPARRVAGLLSPPRSTHHPACPGHRAHRGPGGARLRRCRAGPALGGRHTYVRTWAGFLYLAVVLDACSHRVVGWAMADHLRAESVVEAVEMALWQRRPPGGVIHHSDQGSQYTSLLFGRRLREAGMLASMGSRGDCFDNAMAEVSSPPSHASCWRGSTSRRAPRRGWRCSTTSKGSTTRIGGIRRWGTCHPRRMRGGGQRQAWARSVLLSTEPGQLHHSNGRTKGQINRLKTRKRQMYGRAGSDLLRIRVLATA